MLLYRKRALQELCLDTLIFPASHPLYRENIDGSSDSRNASRTEFSLELNVSPCFLSFISAFSQAQLREPR